jgi:hypothetical protein
MMVGDGVYHEHSGMGHPAEMTKFDNRKTKIGPAPAGEMLMAASAESKLG